ncbi:hypothetical protein Gogos_010047 [Gossypium gossypioides]|uniref:DUF4283 domain-containing protein n=1 Tax=Gossypium gossypioides TaxID=34282 RepID=A0A7J9BJY4_GOSGO|nr:hypothetical protein [Gossypium gossypioides]
MANLNLDEGEEEAWIFKEETRLAKSTFEYCIMGCFLTVSVVHFQAMRNTMTNLRRPLGGVTILDLGEKRYLFKFYNPLDLDRVINGTPWTFNNHLLVFNLLKEDKDSLQVALQFGNFIGEFVDYDAKQSNWGYKSYLRIRVKIDIRKPLKQEGNNVILGNKSGLGNHESNFRRENQIRQQADWTHKFDPIRGLNLEGKSVISRFSVVTEQWVWEHKFQHVSS